MAGERRRKPFQRLLWLIPVSIHFHEKLSKKIKSRFDAAANIACIYFRAGSVVAVIQRKSRKWHKLHSPTDAFCIVIFRVSCRFTLYLQTRKLNRHGSCEIFRWVSPRPQLNPALFLLSLPQIDFELGLLFLVAFIARCLFLDNDSIVCLQWLQRRLFGSCQPQTFRLAISSFAPWFYRDE